MGAKDTQSSLGMVKFACLQHAKKQKGLAIGTVGQV